MNDDERFVEVARFMNPFDYPMPVALLESEGISCFMRNVYSTQVMGIIDVGGARLEVIESEADRARQILRDSGYEMYLFTE